jgi:hypothetical protein
MNGCVRYVVHVLDKLQQNEITAPIVVVTTAHSPNKSAGLWLDREALLRLRSSGSLAGAGALIGGKEHRPDGARPPKPVRLTPKRCAMRKEQKKRNE